LGFREEDEVISQEYHNFTPIYSIVLAVQN